MIQNNLGRTFLRSSLDYFDCQKWWSYDKVIYKKHLRLKCSSKGELVTTEEARRRQEAYDKFASAGRFSSALLVVREHLPSGKACLRINIDATRVGNVARFINHSCDGGNLSTALIRSTGILLPRLCFFASKNIKQDEELTFSYGDIRMRANGLQCFCSSSCCFGVLPSEDTWLEEGGVLDSEILICALAGTVTRWKLNIFPSMHSSWLKLRKREKGLEMWKKSVMDKLLSLWLTELEVLMKMKIWSLMSGWKCEN